MLALLVPSALMLGALGSQYIGGLYPCEMCHWQRWPHEFAIVAALFAFGTRNHRAAVILTVLAALGIATSGALGVFHAGVEYGWWPGITSCSTTASATTLEAIMAAPVIRCDTPQWTLAGVSLAGFNAIFSIGSALAIFGLLARRGISA
ncbi:MAG: disulfide bond formation protein B [Alphaproteobacteria bacterium]|nr:disulfide bond formation protein B [Alphaproteobacteria bacterium]